MTFHSTCRTCGDTYGGNKQGHCTNCHRTFTTDNNFDAHLTMNGPKVAGCNNPETVKHPKTGQPRFKAREGRNGTTLWADARSTWTGPTTE